MNDPRDVVAAKRDGRTLEPDELRSFVLAYARGELPDYLAAAFLMAAFINGLDASETLALTRAMAASYGRDRIRVNAICPGTIRTRLTADIIERAEREAAEGRTIPLGRVGEPEDIARCALFLASDDSAWISGTEIVVDGGALAATT